MAEENGLWTDDEVHALIDIWEEDTIQAQLEGMKCNKAVYNNLKNWIIYYNDQFLKGVGQ